jgi:hypothetical protein
MELDAVLQLPKYHRRSFFALTALSMSLLILADVYIFNDKEPLDKVASGIISHVIAGAASAILVIGFLSFFIPRDIKQSSLAQVPAPAITGEFEKLLASATRWRFKGNFGRYLRGKVLPTLSVKSQVDVDASIIDPRNPELCAQHARYRGEINAIDRGRMYTAEDVAREAVTTIMHCAWHVENRGISIDLYLTDFYDPMRIDASDAAMIVTMEDRRRPALKLTSENFMYDHFMTHMRYLREQGEKLDLTGFKRVAGFHEVYESDITDFMTKIGMGPLCTQLGAGKILADCRANYDPYES